MPVGLRCRTATTNAHSTAPVVVTARLAALPPTQAFSPLVDTRMLTKPRSFSGREEGWSNEFSRLPRTARQERASKCGANRGGVRAKSGYASGGPFGQDPDRGIRHERLPELPREVGEHDQTARCVCRRVGRRAGRSDNCDISLRVDSMIMCSRNLWHWNVNDSFNDATAWMDNEEMCMEIVSACDTCKRKLRTSHGDKQIRRCTTFATTASGLCF